MNTKMTNGINVIMKYFGPTVIAVAICYLVGYISSLLQQESLAMWYPMLTKPAITPPDWVFPIAWSIIYLCMGISIALMWYKPETVFKPIIRLFAIQLLLNFAWSFLFFSLHSPAAAFIDIIALDVIVILYITKSYNLCKGSALLFVPYIAWLMFATYLNGFIMLAN
jgi:tryptophan-rich sensory protein